MAVKLSHFSLVPFIVAVTGHRDLRPQDLEHLRHEVRNIFVKLRRRMPSTPLVLLSGLAEGADQLVAEVAVEQRVSLAAALPMPVDIYEEQMADESRKKLHTLLALSSVQMTLPSGGRTPEQIRTSESARDLCYETLALFIAAHGQALIALWDGKHSDKRGGTSDVIHYVCAGTAREKSDEPQSFCGAVYQVVTPRMSGSEQALKVKTVTLGCASHQVLVGKRSNSKKLEDLSRVTFSQVQMNFERFNREALRKDEWERPKSCLIRDATIALSSFQVRLQMLYQRADAVSVRANDDRKVFLAAILFVALTGTLFYSIQGEMFGDRIALWFSFPSFVIAALILHRAARATHVEERYLDVRALAEALRVQFFWDIAGIRQSVGRYYLIDRSTELDWIRFALNNVWLLRTESHDDSAAQPNLRIVLEHWVKHQEIWYGGKANRQLRIVHQRHKVANDGLKIAVLWSLLVPTCILIHNHRCGASVQKGFASLGWIYEVSHIALAVPALLAGAYRLWVEQAGYEEQSRDYRYMEHQFLTKAMKLEQYLNSPTVAESLLLELGIEALKENGRWLLLHRERPLEVLSTP